ADKTSGRAEVSHLAARIDLVRGEEVARVTAGGIDGEVGFVEAVEAFFVARAPRKDSPHTRAAYRRDLYGVGELVGRALGVPLPLLRCDALTLSALRRGFAAFA